MKIGLILESLKLPFYEALNTAQIMGVRGIQIYAAGGEFDADTVTAAAVSALKKDLRARGMEVSALCGDMGGHGFADEGANEERIRKSKRILDLANTLDCGIVTAHIGVIPENTASETYRVMADALSTIGLYAASKDSCFAIETGPEPVPVLKGFLERMPPKGIAVNYDPANLHMVTHEDAVAGVSALKDYIVHTHAKDGRQGKKFDPKEVYRFFAEGGIEDMNLGDYFTETPLGEGGVDFDGYISALKKIGYDGYLTIERETGGNPRADIAKAIGFLQKYIG
jgi:sugar phosphate isomerase/epimerase